ncbi:CRISPR-associated helicase Cas3' [Candidatus Bathycorpusculum sp.]|uniref:CRISPR-associated helicase Cas3' n=1 Tax=Candidatus Bathycorpusculum sp. TaxID=2994959 RepID=UPI00281C932E|nr:CRISPR-associated helicase Cas3' [Candidatus Termitimicrobium sp.]MCL2431014.1 CRISPR-associated helicase Cas3' [Candidatus Termitimicrobium sp.]
MINESEFWARPKNSMNNSGLLEHSLKTAQIARELTISLGLDDAAFYAGLLHDIGKLNPYYQLLFLTGQINRDYIRAHAIFSALAVNTLLNIATLSKRSQKQALFAVAGHHSKLVQFTKSLEYIDKSGLCFEKSHNGTYDNLQRFSQMVSDREEFKGLAWDKCLRRFKKIPQSEMDFIAEGDCVLEFLDFSSVFSALIQADRGSFFDWSSPAFNINFNTSVLVRKCSRLSDVRMNFQEYILSKNSFQDNLAILKAPTGIGKTKLFLDIVNKLSDTHRFERVFYFSPLLALTDDFEGKLFSTKYADSVINHDDAEKVLVYNHEFTGNLLEKRQSTDHSVMFDVDIEDTEDHEFFKTKEYFDRESFNKQLIITTTQRLLMVLYSNRPADKQKLLSFKNSFLIIDEVQTIPKVLLPNIIALLKTLTIKYNTKILLVSATIPDELQNLSTLKTHKEFEETYMQMTVKQIEYRDTLDAGEVARLGVDERTLFLFNTRRKAVNFFKQLSVLKPDVHYLSSGIRKCDRRNIIQEKLQGKEPVTVVSTQVLEAGVDVSFSRMYRELAPLDNIVQAMGRLSREGECSDPMLTVFRVDADYKPYSELEVEESKILIPKLNSSIALYAALPDYYKTVSAENLRNKNLSKELDGKMRGLNFDAVWDFVKKNALPSQLGDPLFVPKLQDYDEVRQQFLSSNAIKTQKLYTRYVAQLPRSLKKINGLEAMLDEELLDMNILLPKKEALDCVYDPKIGLDKWVKNE